ncbi:hypothetical protein MMC27_003706 [Xylographa pallens]|nr:hypothetical protein [Xylographa pallens]
MTQSKEKNTRIANLAPASHIERFFKSYPEFDFNPLHSSAAEFQRMRRFYGWQRDDILGIGNEAWGAYRTALVKEFNRLFGTDEHDLLAWQTLCGFVGLRESAFRGNSATCDFCREALQNRHFNLVDLVDARRHGDEPAQVFPTEEALQEYTKRTASYFPHDNSKAGRLLKNLLRKPRKDMAGNLNTFPSYPPPKHQDKPVQSKSSKMKEASSSTQVREVRTAKKHRMIAEALEAADSYVSVEFESK